MRVIKSRLRLKNLLLHGFLYLEILVKKSIGALPSAACRKAVVATCALVVGMVFASPANAVLVFSTGFNGNLNRDAGTAGTAAIVGSPTGFSFVPDTVGGAADTVIQQDEVDPSLFVDLTGTGVLGETYTVVFDTKVSFASGFQTLIGPESGDQDIFVRSTGQGGGVDIGSNTGSTNVNDGAWHRIVVTSGAGLRGNLYIDGVKDAGIPGTATTDDVLTASIGLFRDNSTDNVVGSRFANFALYDVELDAGQVASLGAASAGVITLDPTPTVLGLVIDRDTGAVSIQNSTGTAQMVKGYSVRSSAGTLVESNAAFLADTDSDWVQFTADNAKTDLSEGHLTTDSFGTGTVHSFGADTWFKYFDETGDISFEYLDGTGATVTGSVEFVGTTQTTPFEEGDLNFDGAIDGLDWDVYVASLGGTFAAQTDPEAYRDGDFNNDGVNNYTDFLAFQDLFDGANGPGALAAVIGGAVPEPASLVLFAMAGGLFAGARRSRVPGTQQS